MTMKEPMDEALNLQITERMPRRLLIRDTDAGREIFERIGDLKELLEAYQAGRILENTGGR